MIQELDLLFLLQVKIEMQGITVVVVLLLYLTKPQMQVVSNGGQLLRMITDRPIQEVDTVQLKTKWDNRI